MKKLLIAALLLLALPVGAQDTKFYGTGLGGNPGGAAKFDLQWSLVNGLYAYWNLDEASGNPRAKTQGSAASAALSEVGGAVSTAAGVFASNALASTEASTTSLQGTITPVDLSRGFTIAIRFYMPASASNSPKSLFSIGTGGIITTPYIDAYRYYDSDFLDCVMTWAPGYAPLPLPRLGPFSVNTWHLLILWYDAAAGRFSGQVDDAYQWCVGPADPGCNPIAAHPAGQLSVQIPPAAGAMFTALDTVNLLGKYDGNFVNWDGRADEFAIWTRPLSEVERHAVFTKVAAGF